MNVRAKHTASLVRAHRRAGIASRRGRLPRQQPPTLIERAYARELVARVTRAAHAALAPFAAAMPGILGSSVLRRDADEGKRISDLLDTARGHMQRALLTPDLNRLAADFAAQTQAHQRVQLLRQTRAALGVDVFLHDEKLAARAESFVHTNVGLIKNMSHDLVGRVERSALAAVQDGTLADDYAETLRDQFDFPEARATLIARDQVGKLYGQTNADRQQGLGITGFYWRTSMDERVRSSHAELEGQRFAYADPPENDDGEPILPGKEIQCRCTAEPDFSDILGDADSDASGGADSDAPDDTPDDTE